MTIAVKGNLSVLKLPTSSSLMQMTWMSITLFGSRRFSSRALVMCGSQWKIVALIHKTTLTTYTYRSSHLLNMLVKRFPILVLLVVAAVIVASDALMTLTVNHYHHEAQQVMTTAVD